MEANDTSTVNIDLCISVLENLRNRSQLYATMFPHLTDDYLAELVNTEHTAIDSIISILKNQEHKELGRKQAIVSVLKDLQTMISNGESFESIVKRWIPVDDDPINAEEALRVAYAQTIGEAISFLQNCS